MNIEWTEKDEQEANELLARIHAAVEAEPIVYTSADAEDGDDIPNTERCPMPSWAINTAIEKNNGR